jgi:hypothetical protein
LTLIFLFLSFKVKIFFVGFDYLIQSLNWDLSKCGMACVLERLMMEKKRKEKRKKERLMMHILKDGERFLVQRLMIK